MWTTLHLIAIIIAAFFAFLALTFSVTLMFAHIRHYSIPSQQRYIVRILAMVPIYAICSLISLSFQDLAMYFATLRDCYEAFVLYSFMTLLVECVGGEERLVHKLESKRRTPHLVPLCCVRFNPGRSYLLTCKRGILQYALIKPVTSILAIVFNIFGIYGEGTLSWKNGFTWISIINNVSATFAIYFLIEFYTVMRSDLRGHRPLARFLVIKGVVFFSYWQSLVLSGLAAIHIINGNTDWSAEQIAAALHDFLIGPEMFLFALAHLYAFSHKPYIQPTWQQFENGDFDGNGNRRMRQLSVDFQNVRETIVPADFVADAIKTVVPTSLFSGNSATTTGGSIAETVPMASQNQAPMEQELVFTFSAETETDMMLEKSQHRHSATVLYPNHFQAAATER